MAARRIVVDASVARASGERTPQARASVAALEALRQGKHIVVTSQTILAEWRKHASRFANTWLAELVSRGRIAHVDESVPQIDLDALELAAKKHQAGFNLMVKDLLLVEAALATDRRILSLDEHAREAFRRACASIVALQKILWANPAQTTERVELWLRDGARREGERELGAKEQSEAAPSRRTATK